MHGNTLGSLNSRQREELTSRVRVGKRSWARTNPEVKELFLFLLEHGGWRDICHTEGRLRNPALWIRSANL